MVRHRGWRRAAQIAMPRPSRHAPGFSSLRRIASLLLVPILAACSNGRSDDSKESGQPTAEVALDDGLINESSGLARSQRSSELLWTHNDSGGAAELYGIDLQGHHRVTLRISGALAVDWEDLSSYTSKGTPYLLIGDMGDNGAIRPVTTYYRIEEPAITPTDTLQTISVRPSAVYTLIYPDGPRDAESLAVDGQQNMAYVLSKRDAVPQLYRFGLDSSGPLALPRIMEALGPITIPRAPADYTGDVDAYNWPTAMDFDNSLRRVYVGTLLDGYFYDRADGESWAQALAHEPSRFDLPDYPQIEAGSFDRGSRDALYLTSEQLPTPLARLQP
ncbi:MULTISPECIES: hypothetical protein [Hydrocarboniphaga]|uniref:Uncharacterized protein n=1 Tax=Hydrocarboniphaga effusa AP103 TaxID=1172194 RepID=I8TEU8_9GAMM|nr:MULTISPECIES: hypothetical protein [Hydrocarboniphaga]EIT72248.1 hypothetical protein WQQ_23850 [Hydrocarboniphaga effusa AP103]MDZ4079620.1 hypothetical protein [Hydrocarboniphaga sp.]